MENVYSVNQINSYIKNMFAQEPMLRSISVKGEASNVKYHSSGHIYFTIKDNSGTLLCVMFSSYRAAGLDFDMQDGQQIIVRGSIEVYERDGKYQMYAKKIELDGEGQLYEKFAKLKKELEEMGMFAAEYKKPIPRFVRTLGVVTARTGAVIQDIINVTTRRNSHVRIILCPAKVQGEGAAESIVNGIHALEAMNVDVIIIGRGGGSIEDLWAFNEELVARAIFDCEIPIISAVGHETDTTIADFVADLRAPTPSAAAELAVYEFDAFEDMLDKYRNDLKDRLENSVERKRDRYEKLMLRLRNESPGHKLREQRMRLVTAQDKLGDILQNRIKERRTHIETVQSRLGDAVRTGLVKKRHLLDIKIERLEALSPLKRLNSGYAFVEGKDGCPVKSIGQVNKGDELTLNLKDGSMITEVKEVKGKEEIR